VLRLILLLVMFVLIARSFWSVVDGVVRGASSSQPGGGGRSRGSRGTDAPVPVKMVPCPVCGTFVVPGKALSTTSMRGQPIWFCSDKCRAEYRES
jgi:YHS domain-containing protein